MGLDGFVIGFCPLREGELRTETARSSKPSSSMTPTTPHHSPLLSSRHTFRLYNTRPHPETPSQSVSPLFPEPPPVHRLTTALTKILRPPPSLCLSGPHGLRKLAGIRVQFGNLAICEMIPGIWLRYIGCSAGGFDEVGKVRLREGCLNWNLIAWVRGD